MIVELRPKATVALPKDVAKELKLKTGDKFELTVEDGAIKLVPVYIVEKKHIKALRQNVNKLKKASADEPNADLAGLEEVVNIIEEK